MKAFILAAGVSRRLYPHTYNIPKCLLKVNGKPIINYQLEALEELNIKEVTMILGYHREMIKDHVRTEFPGLKLSTFAKTSHGKPLKILLSFINGVLPIVSRIFL